MKFLIDNSKPDEMHELFGGQLLTPLTNYTNWSPECYAIDNGAYSGFDQRSFKSLLQREEACGNLEGCLFVCVPDIVCDGRRTLEVWKERYSFIGAEWPLALVAQNGLEDMEIPWEELDCLFVGGCDNFKQAYSTLDICKTAKILGKHVHVGRINSDRRFANYEGIADTCDGSGVSRGLGRHLNRIMGGRNERMLFDEHGNSNEA